MTAIHTRYLGPTGFKGSRICAETMSDRPIRRYWTWDNQQGHIQTHQTAAVRLAKELDWDNHPMVSGGTKEGYVHVFIHDSDVIPETKDWTHKKSLAPEEILKNENDA